MQPESAAHLWDAATAAKLICDFVAGKTEEEFNQDLLVRSAVERQLEVLGEALNRLRRDDQPTADRVPDAHKIIGMRNVIAHEYGELDYGIVWAATETRVPRLIATFDLLLAEAASEADQV